MILLYITYVKLQTVGSYNNKSRALRICDGFSRPARISWICRFVSWQKRIARMRMPRCPRIHLNESLLTYPCWRSCRDLGTLSNPCPSRSCPRGTPPGHRVRFSERSRCANRPLVRSWLVCVASQFVYESDRVTTSLSHSCLSFMRCASDRNANALSHAEQPFSVHNMCRKSGQFKPCPVKAFSCLFPLQRV